MVDILAKEQFVSIKEVAGLKPQNIYDDETFFNGYKKLRENINSANILEEKPAIFSLLPDLKGCDILDLGCGYGENCKAFSDMGARSVTGIDISAKMLDVALRENAGLNIAYYNMGMEEIGILDLKFDIVVSSLAVHYVSGFNKLVRDIHSLLNDNGIFVFSQEHPLTTAPIEGPRWMKDAAGNVDHYRLTDYARSGERKVSWIVDDVVKYHRTFSDIFNALVFAGFCIERVVEPIPTGEMIKKLPAYEKDLHKPNFLVIKGTKR